MNGLSNQLVVTNSLKKSRFEDKFDSSSNFSSDDDEEQQIMVSGGIVKYLPNGNILLVGDSDKCDDFSLDFHSDTEILLTGSFYRGDIPKYLLLEGNEHKSSFELAQKRHRLPSGAIIPLKLQSNQLNELFQPLSRFKKHNDTIH